MKPKILVCSESSKVASGFGVYNKHLLEGLYKSNKYELAEFASYGMIGDKEKYKIPWRYYPNAVVNNDPRYQEYSSSAVNQFGKWRFDKVVADFRPHIVIDIRDYWMSSYQARSPFRRLFHWILMPTIDSYPQQDEWLDTYINADAIFTYSEWGRDILKLQTNNSINFIDVVSPCADSQSFKINNKVQDTKSLLGLDPDCTIIGTVMRNQKRKLYPELINAFEKILHKLELEDSTKYKNTILYLHTSYPDQGWDMNNLISNSKFANKIYFTYTCKNCGTTFASNLNGITQYCKKCKNYSAIIPNVSNPIDTNVLGNIMSTFDLYIQYSICEGFGMPQIEAAYCGVPVVTVDYSAMTDVIKNINAYPIKIGSYFKELETSAIRVYPDENHLIDTVVKIISTPELMRKKIGFENHNKAKNYYSWNKIVDIWTNYIDSIDITKYENSWNAPIRSKQQIQIDKLPQNTSVYETIYMLDKLYFTDLGIKISDYWILKLINSAENGYTVDGNVMKPFSANNLIDIINQSINNYNISEQLRVNNNSFVKEDYIVYGNN